MSDLYQSKGLQLVLLIRPSISILFKLGATRSLINIITQFSVQNAKSATVVKLTVVPCPPVVEVKIKRPDTKYQLGFSVQNGVVSVNFHMSIKLQHIDMILFVFNLSNRFAAFCEEGSPSVVASESVTG